MTHWKLELKKDTTLHICEGKLSSRRNDQTRLDLFKQLFPRSLVEYFVTNINLNYTNKRPRAKNYKGLVTCDDFYAFIGMVLKCCCSSEVSLKEFLRMKERVGLSERKWIRIVQHLDFDLEHVSTELSSTFHSAILLGEAAALDETILPWFGGDPAVKCIPRKPNGTGFKIFTICVQLTRTKRPFCVYFCMDVDSSAINVATILDQTKEILPSWLTIIADSWFGSLGWMEKNSKLALTFAIQENQQSHIWDVFAHDLQQQQYRMFTNGKIILSVYKDASLVRTASTCFTAKPPRTEPPTILQQIRLPPRLSEAAMEKLRDFSLLDLQSLAYAVGESKSK